jgi:acetolactate synthase-1/2/3 large subunit
MLVDDDADQLRSMKRSLRNTRDIDLTVVDNGIDALLDIGVRKPELIVMDVFMPGLDGIEACRRLKANRETRDIEIVLMSGEMTPQLEIAARAAGASRALEKPVDVGELLGQRPRTGEMPPLAPAEPPIRAADYLVRTLAACGVSQVFGIPGGAISPVHDALLDSPVRVVTTRHESGAMFAAAGYAHTTGRLGVVAVTSGPGVLNAMTGLASAWCDGLPVLLLVGEVPRRAQGKGVLQDGSAYGLHIVDMVRYITKLAGEVPSAEQLPHILRRAIAAALTGKRGPVVLTLPMDVMTASIAPPVLVPSIEPSPDIPDGALAEVAALFEGAQRPLILAGSGARGGTTPALLREVAERLDCPVITTPKAKGVFPETHRLALGVFGIGGHPSARAYVSQGIDVLLAIGTTLGDLSTEGFARELQPARALIQVDIEGGAVGRAYPPTHSFVAPADAFLAGLRPHLPRFLLSLVRHTPPGVTRFALTDPDRGPISPQVAIEEIQAVLPADTIYTVDSGEHFLFATHYLRISHPDSFVVMTGLGSMGQSIGAAIGASLGHPGRSVAAICGDGCFAMTAFEVATAVAERIPVRVFVFNDQRLGMVETGHQAVYGRRPSYPTNPMDVHVIAEGLGALALRVEKAGDILAARELLVSHPGPVVVDVRIDPEVRLPKKDRVAAFAAK